MGSLNDLLAPAQLPYPGAINQPGASGTPSGSGGSGAPQSPTATTSFQPPARTGVINEMFAPTDLPYPLPVGRAQQPVTPTLNAQGVATVAVMAPPQCSPTPAIAPAPSPAPSAPVIPPVQSAPAMPTASAPATSPASAAAATPAPSPVTVVVAPWSIPNFGGAGGNGTATPSGSAPASAAQSAPTAATAPAAAPSGSASGSPASSSTATTGAPAPSPLPVALESLPLARPSDQIVTEYGTNPRLRARPPRAQEVYLEEVLDEKVTVRMLTKDSEPIAFIVPTGYDAVAFYLGAIELNEGIGKPCDLDEVVTIGDLVIGGVTDGQQLEAGDQLTVTVPWRHASWVELAAEHLRVAITARFFNQTNGLIN